jgi:hypothetical protein
MAVHLGQRIAGHVVIHYSVATPCVGTDGAELYRHPREEILTLVCLNRAGTFERLDIDPTSGIVRSGNADTISR